MVLNENYMISIPNFTLNNGNSIPQIAFGPGILRYKISYPLHRYTPNGILRRLINRFYTLPSQDRCYIHSINSAINNGFRLIDYSETYGHYDLVKKAISASGVKREDLFFTTRVGNRLQDRGRKAIRESFFKGLKELEMDYVDLLQFHWPVTGKFVDTWQEMTGLQKEGYVRNIGVANCHQHHLEAIYESSGVWPSVNQFEIHPLFTQKPLLKYCQERGIVVEAYTPIARYDDRLVRLPLVKNIAEKYDKSIVQVILRWHVQNGVIPVVRAMSAKHQQENLDIFDFALTPEEMAAIESVNINSRLRYDPDNCDFNIL